MTRNERLPALPGGVLCIILMEQGYGKENA